MLCKTSALTAAALAIAVPTLASAANLEIKPGAWEFTINTKMSGALAEQAAKDPNAPAESSVEKICIKDTDLPAETFYKGMDESCKKTIVSDTGSELIVDELCEADGKKGTVHAEVKVADPEHFTQTMQMNLDGQEMALDMSAKFTGDSCTDEHKPFQ